MNKTLDAPIIAADTPHDTPETRNPLEESPVTSQNTQSLPDDTHISENEPPSIQELKFFLNQLYLILKPVMACILLSILWVKLTNASINYWDYGFTNQSNAGLSGGSVGAIFDSDASPGGISNALLIALIIIGQIVVATFVILCLFRYGKLEIFFGFIVLSTSGLLGYFGYRLGIALLGFFNAPMDYITFIFFVVNFAVGGLAVVFYKGPMWLQQCYLIIMSSLMAFSFSSLPALVTWILLAMLAIWDLIAVLTPYGPLKLLIETSRSQNKEIPALLYTVAVWMMASGGELEQTEKTVNPADTNPGAPPSLVSEPLSDYQDTRPLTDRTRETIDGIELQDLSNREQPNQPEPPKEEDEPRSGLKLGLGDFVFYSVLVGRAGNYCIMHLNPLALYDWLTTITCTIAVLSGLTMTIILLALNRRALPALPISIAFGILFYFVSALVLVPFVNSLTLIPARVNVTDANGLWVGKGIGATTLFV